MPTKKHPINVLIITNMGPTKEKPFLGIFVKNQYNALKILPGLSVDYFEMPDIRAPQLIKKLMRYPIFACLFIKKHIFKRKPYDILHIHFFFPTIVLGILYKYLRNPNCKIVITFHGSDIYHYTPFKWYYTWCLKLVNYALFVSENLKNRVNLKAPQKTLCAGILNIFDPSITPIKKEYNLIFVGSLDHNKGVDRLINFLETTTNTYSVCIAGVGPYGEKLRSLRLKHQLNIVGSQTPEQLKNLYYQSKFLINLSRNESFGLVITEAMASGIPIIATDTDGGLAQIKHNENGYLIKQKDLNKTLYDTVEKALNIDDNTYYKMCQCAISSSKPHLLSNVTQTLAKIYTDMST